MKSIVGWTVAVAALLATSVPLSAVAQHRDHRRTWQGDIRNFDNHDMHRWRSGSWRHGSHSGRQGWWWVAGGMWYYYPQPVYPFPDPYRPPVFALEPAPPPVVVQLPAPPPAPVQPVAQVWYYCEAEAGYYPYVAACPSGWKTVPATPPGVPQ